MYQDAVCRLRVRAEGEGRRGGVRLTSPPAHRAVAGAEGVSAGPTPMSAARCQRATSGGRGRNQEHRSAVGEELGWGQERKEPRFPRTSVRTSGFLRLRPRGGARLAGRPTFGCLHRTSDNFPITRLSVRGLFCPQAVRSAGRGRKAPPTPRPRPRQSREGSSERPLSSPC